MSLDSSNVLAKNPFCRYRVKANGLGYLIKFSQVFEINAVGAAIWNTIDGKVSVGEITNLVSARLDVNFTRIAQLTVASIVKLIEYGFVEIKDPGQPLTSVESLYKSDPFSSVLERIRKKDCLLDEVDDLTKSKIFRRLIQILCEAAVQYDTSYGDCEKYVTFLSSIPEQAMILHFGEELQFLSWRFSTSRNEIVMCFVDATYSGDVDHRN